MSKSKRTRGSGSIRKRGQVLYLRYRPPGYDSQIEQSFPRQAGESMPKYRERAEAALTALTLGMAAGTRIAPTARTVQELADSYLAAVKRGIKARTYEGYESFIRLYILPTLGTMKVSRLTTEDIRALQQHLLDQPVAGNRPMAVSTAREVMSRLHDMIKFAMDGQDSRQFWGLTFDPWPQRRFRWPDQRQRPAPHTHDPYTLDEARAFVAATPDEMRPHILCALLLMLRDGELRAMRWQHLDEDAGLYSVCETHSRAHGFTTTKTASSQAIVPVPQILLHELRLHRTRQLQMRLKKGPKWQDLDLIFATSKGTVMPHPWYHLHLKNDIATRAGVRPVSLHTLRKTGASILESLGVSRAETQAALRHTRSTITDGYVAVYMEQRRQHIEQVAQLIIEPPSCPQFALNLPSKSGDSG